MSQSGDITATHGRWAGDGAGLTGLDAGGLATGTVPRARLAGNYDVSVTGNAATSTRLQTGRLLTVGNTGKIFDGSSNVAWTLGEIGALPLTGGTLSGVLNIRTVSPTLNLQDSNGRNGVIQVNADKMYFLRGDAVDGTGWSQTAGRWPLVLNLENNDATFGGSVFSSAYFYHSDRRLKDRITTIDGMSGLDLVNKIRPVSYDWKSNGRNALGVIAQEVEAIIPDMVNTDAEGMKSVDYIQFIAPMIAAIQDLDDRVSALEAVR
jgi:hypothetical protein